MSEFQALNCWGGNQLITLGGSTIGSSSGCPANGDTCKVFCYLILYDFIFVIYDLFYTSP